MVTIFNFSLVLFIDWLICLKTRKQQPYMDRKRFPADWASTEIVKQYLPGQHKTKQHKHQVVATSDDDNIDGNQSQGEDKGGDEGEEESNQQHERGGNGRGNSEEEDGFEDLPACPSKKCRVEAVLD